MTPRSPMQTSRQPRFRPLGGASGGSTCASTCAGSGRIATRVGAVFRAGAGGRGLADDRAAVHAVHRRPGAAEHGARPGGAAHPAATWRALRSSRGRPRPSLIGVLKDYRQRLLNMRVMLALRRSLFDRLLHLPLPKLWDMKTGGILSRLTGDVDTTTGLLADGDRVAVPLGRSAWPSRSAC